MSWLARPLVCDGKVVLDAFDPERLTDADLRDVCLRMHLILGTIEMPRCEERLLPVAIFDRMDTLESMVLHGHGGYPRLSEWSDLISEFGEYYGLEGQGPITVVPAIYREVGARFARSPGDGGPTPGRGSGADRPDACP
jgi:hypothetical protein